MKNNIWRHFASFSIFFSLFFMLCYRSSANGVVPATETEGIVDGGLYQIRSESVENMCLMYSVSGQDVFLTQYFSEMTGLISPKNLYCQFYVSYLEEGMYSLIPMCWRTARLQADGDRLTVALPNNSPEQRWHIIPCEGGYEIRSAANEHWALCGVDVYDVFLSNSDGHSTWSFEPVLEMEKPTNYIYVKAPAHWLPGLSNLSEAGIWLEQAVMDQCEDDWCSFPSPNIDGNIWVCNYADKPTGAIYTPDVGAELQIEVGKDYWIVVHDDPNVDGDLKLTVYDSKPENLPETADPAALAPAAAALIVSTLALLMSVKLKPKEL